MRIARGCVIWVGGLPSSGKSSFATGLCERLKQLDAKVCLLDGDVVRDLIHPAPGYDPRARDDFYETLTGLAVLLARQGLLVIVAATAGRQRYRERARERSPRFIEVEIATPRAECERRDTKSLYAKAREGSVTDVPGVDAPYEAPERPDVTARGGRDRDALERVLTKLELAQT